jgi:hypothetical protein
LLNGSLALTADFFALAGAFYQFAIRSEKSYPRLYSIPGKANKAGNGLANCQTATKDNAAKTEEGILSASLIWNQNI